ncbi:MAG: hypothetical protein AAFV33_12920 [Chloroflexota bacterium]
MERLGATLAAEFSLNWLLALGVFVVVVAGPVNDGTYTWWQVQSANGLRGWVAGTIEGRDTIGP